MIENNTSFRPFAGITPDSSFLLPEMRV